MQLLSDKYSRIIHKLLNQKSENGKRKKEPKKEKYTGMGYRPSSFNPVLGGISNQATIL
jgi:hypothetical protein